MSIKIKYATKRHNTWVYRRTYPKHLQEHLGSSLKQSLKTADAKTAKARVAELNQTYQSIVKGADAHVSANTDQTPVDIPNTCGTAADPGPRIERPRYQPLRLLGDRCIAELAQSYLSYQSERLRPGSYKAVRFAIELLVSHLGKAKVGDIAQQEGRNTLSLIRQLSPNVRKYKEGHKAGLSELVKLSKQVEPDRILAPQTQARIWKHMLQFLDWCVEQGELRNNPWQHLSIRERPEVYPHKVLTDEQVATLLQAKDRVLSSALLFGLLTGMRSGEICERMATDVICKGDLGRFIKLQPNEYRQLKSKAAEQEVPLHRVLEQLLETSLPRKVRLFPHLTVDRVVKAYYRLKQTHPTLTGKEHFVEIGYEIVSLAGPP